MAFGEGGGSDCDDDGESLIRLFMAIRVMTKVKEI